MGVVSHFWHLFWPLLFITIGVIMLAERAALAADGGYPPIFSSTDPRAATGVPPYPGQPVAFIPPITEDYKDPFERKS
jgi:hypothetical protein